VLIFDTQALAVCFLVLDIATKADLVADYYSRYRPGLGTVLVFLTLLTNVAQYIVQHLSRYSETARIRRIQDRAKEVAWGSASAKPAKDSGKKKVRVPLGVGESSTATMTVEANGRVCFIDEAGKGD